MDRQTGEVLWANNPDLPLPPASTTKIVTATLALQSGRLDESFEVSPEAAQEPPSKISLQQGWEVRLRDLVYAVLLNSANDASVVVAEGLSGSVREFAARMNVHAYAAGATNTHFVNPNGLPADDHYTTARDLTTLFSYGLRLPQFREVLNTRATTIVPTEGSSRPISLHSKNRLLQGYPIHVIGKTGWTRAAGKCFVGAGRIDDREVLVAVMRSDNLWVDLRHLLEYAFQMGPAPEPRLGTTTVAAAPLPPPSEGAGDTQDDDRFELRLATFQSQAAAQALVQQVRGQGFNARLVTLRQRRSTTYQVSVGTYNDRRSAQKAAHAISRKNPALKPQVVGL